MYKCSNLFRVIISFYPIFATILGARTFDISSRLCNSVSPPFLKAKISPFSAVNAGHSATVSKHIGRGKDGRKVSMTGTLTQAQEEQ